MSPSTFKISDAELSDEEISSPHFRRRFLFVPVVTAKRAQADEIVEFVPYDSELGKSINENYQQVLLKEVEKAKVSPQRDHRFDEIGGLSQV